VSAERSISVSLSNQLTEIERLSHIVERFCAAHEVSSDAVYRINLSLDEVITNIVLHGYDDVREHEIVVNMALEPPAIVVEVIDDGRPFNPLDAPPVDFDIDPLERAVGGLGLHLVRSVMDATEYRYVDGRNVFVMRKTVL
jgi:anti-sigma regulatory factor (Ser/Thr protein kinase)